MKVLFAAVTVGMLMLVATTGVATANVVTLTFDPNAIFNFAASDNTRLNQQGTARAIWGQGFTPLPATGRYYQTYNDGTRMPDATAAQDLQSVANILNWTAFAGHQGINWMQLYLQGGNAPNWGEQVVLKSGSMTPSVNGEFGWNSYLQGATPVFDTILGGDPNTNQNAISPDFNPASNRFSVSGDFFVDLNSNGVFDSGIDSDLVVGHDYTIWFFARLNNWHFSDAYSNSGWGPGYVEGSLRANAVPEPSTLALLGLGGLMAGWGISRRSRRA